MVRDIIGVLSVKNEQLFLGVFKKVLLKRSKTRLTRLQLFLGVFRKEGYSCLLGKRLMKSLKR
ncbi:MAG: hypothetical protein DRJ52_03010 [Thermoprotei archaeon]|nr:MAG: hypothetical protein DRJ52_03010 [Thermoprotei archaeon]RLF01031.1 MAG: hypothetical protein DRJ63_00405 [Thermoprotei archaeon]